MSETTRAEVDRDLESIKGWFNPSDRRLFAWLLQRQVDHGEGGDVVELGCYLGKSAVLIGNHLAEGETFTVLDLFESDGPDDSGGRDMHGAYSTLTQAAFEANYLRFHERLPVVIKAPSSAIVDHVAAGSVRFLHVDASHLYEHVAGDADSARKLLKPDGIVVFDDFRAEHTPGVAAAVWEAVLTKGLRPICVTESKLYGTWGDPTELQHEIVEWVRSEPGAYAVQERIAELDVLRTKIPLRRPAAPAPVSQAAPGRAAPKSATAKAAPVLPPRTGLRKVAKDWLPPAVHRAISKQLRKRR
jgi:hypothetical protein